MTGLSLHAAVDVHLLELPVPLAGRAQQHVEELMREFALVHASAAGPAGDSHRLVPARLLELVDSLAVRFAGVNDDARERLEAAIARGDRVIADHVLTLPPEAAAASEALGAMLDECDVYCAAGKDLLTLATPPDLRAYRRWYLDEIVAQLAGGAPTSWPAYAAGLELAPSRPPSVLPAAGDGMSAGPRPVPPGPGRPGPVR
jgi:hypothetical protein